MNAMPINTFPFIPILIVGMVFFGKKIVLSVISYFYYDKDINYLACAQNTTDPQLKASFELLAQVESLIQKELNVNNVFLRTHFNTSKVMFSRFTFYKKLIYLLPQDIDALFYASEKKIYILSLLHHEYTHIKNKDTALHRRPLYALIVFCIFSVVVSILYYLFPGVIGTHIWLSTWCIGILMYLLLMQIYKRMEWAADQGIPNKKEYIEAAIKIFEHWQEHDTTLFICRAFLEHPSYNARIVRLKERLRSISTH